MADFEILGQSKDEPKKDKKKSNKIIEYIKKNPFKVAVIVVALLGVYAWIKSSSKPEAEETSDINDDMVALYSDGYPNLGYTTEAGGGMSTDYTGLITDSMNEIADNLNASFDSKIEGIQSSVDTSNSALWENMDYINQTMTDQSNSINQLVDHTEQQANVIQRQNDIVQMMNNSIAYNGTTSRTTKDALHEANRAIASKYGWTFNNDNWEWYDENGQLLYQSTSQTPIEVDRVQTGTGATSSGSTKPTTSTTLSGGGDVMIVQGSGSSSSSKKSSGSSSSSKTGAGSVIQSISNYNKSNTGKKTNTTVSGGGDVMVV